MKTQAAQFTTLRRIHISLPVTDLAQSVDFYRALLGVEPSKVRPGYARFTPEDPPVNLALNQVNVGGPAPCCDMTTQTSASSLAVVDQPAQNSPLHYGIQVKSTEAVQQMTQRLHSLGRSTRTEQQVTCCYAVQDKVWVDDPDGISWEVFVTLEDDG